MRQLPMFLAACALALCACDKGDGPDGPVEFHVSLTERSGDEASPLADGSSLEIAPAEDREALLVILKGIPSPPADEPLKFALVKSVDAPIYADVDPEDGPEQWITVAEVQDDEGNVLWKDRVNSLFQLLEYLELVLDQQSAINFGITQVFGFVNMQYPQLLQFAVKIPLGIEGGTQYVLKIPKADGEYYEAYRADIATLVADVEPREFEGEVTTLLDNGDPKDTIDIVILGDGYTAEQRERFDLDAKSIADRLAKAEPFKSKIKDFNIHTVWVPSAESGAGYDCTGIITADNGCKKDLRDTVFQMVFVLTALADRFNLALQDTSDRVAMPLQVGRLFDVAAAVPFDEIIMVSNTRRSSGFAGLYVSVLTAYDGRIGFPDTAVHELGHSFGVLGDEYNIEGDPCLKNEPAIPLPPNISATATLADLKWAHLVEEGTPLPTSRGDFDAGREVGAFAGAYNCDELFRASHVCKMRDSEKDFCPVCAEQLVNRMFAYLDPLAYQSAPTAARDGADLVFTVAPTRETIGIEWFLGDEEVGTGAELRLASDSVPTTWTKLSGRAHDASGFIVGEKPRTTTTVDWWIRR